MRIAGAILVAACTHHGAAPHVDAPAPSDWQAPLGAHWTPAGDAVVFRLASTRATQIELDIFTQPSGAPATLTVPMTRDDTSWIARVSADQLPPTIYYGYRVWGPNWPATDVDSDGNRMNPNKLVFDPYARELSHDPGDRTPFRVGANRDIDSAPAAPKGIVLRDDPPDFGTKPARPLRDEIIYEVNLRGFSENDGTPCAGTYAGAAARAQYLADLGVTAVEFLPIEETPNDGNDAAQASANYWGYSTLAYMAPDRRYACDRTPGGPTREVRAMVRAFHDRGIKVYLDIVFNHTAEGGGSSLLSLRGIDNAGYYQLDAAGTGFTNSNGVGADLAAQKPLVQGLVLDALHYWSDTIGIDGFRFDLAPVLGNTCGPGCFQFDPNALPKTIADSVHADLIAEPWAVVAGSYQVGHFPAPWAEWNDKIRDAFRQDQNAGRVVPGLLAERIAGSPNVYGRVGRPPAGGVSYLVSHDGFTLHDLYACNAPNNNQAFPYGPSGGGSTSNYSWDHGGDATAQRQATRTGLALVMLSAGVPMITGGDELARTIHCNNNPYNLDSIANWLDYSTQTDPLWTFTSRLLHFRAAHAELRPADFNSQPLWLDDTGAPASLGYMNDASRPVLAWQTGSIYVAYDRGTASATVTMPAPPAGEAWYRAADTAAWMESQANFSPPGSETKMHGTYTLGARSLAIFIAR